MWNIAHNLGGFAAPLVAGGFAKAMGWKWGMWAPGIIGLVVGTFVLVTWWVAPPHARTQAWAGALPATPSREPRPLAQRRRDVSATFPPLLCWAGGWRPCARARLRRDSQPRNLRPPRPRSPPTPHPTPQPPSLRPSRDKPEDVGFPPVEPVAAKKSDAKKKPDVLKQLVNTVLKNPFIWGMVRGGGGGLPAPRRRGQRSFRQPTPPPLPNPAPTPTSPGPDLLFHLRRAPGRDLLVCVLPHQGEGRGGRRRGGGGG
jgi:hypothetical protein